MILPFPISPMSPTTHMTQISTMHVWCIHQLGSLASVVVLGEFHLLSETKSKSGLNISGHYTKLGAGMFTKYSLTFITHPSVILILHLRNCTHHTKTRLMSRSLQHWWASAMSSTRCKAGVSMQCTMWLTRSPRMLGWHHSNVELMRTWLVQHSFTPINIPFLTCLRNMAFLSSSSIFAMSARLLIRRGSISHTRTNRTRRTHKSWESVVQWLKSPWFTFRFSSQYSLSHGSSTGRGRTLSQTKSTAGLLHGY